MSVKGQKIEIRRSELHTVVATLPLWEIPVVAAVHDEGALKVVGDVVIAHCDLPDAKEEFERLSNRYKLARNDDGSFGLPVVATVYGQHAAGVSALKRAIAEAQTEADSLV
jgi:hypothetical protein